MLVWRFVAMVWAWGSPRLPPMKYLLGNRQAKWFSTPPQIAERTQKQYGVVVCLNGNIGQPVLR